MIGKVKWFSDVGGYGLIERSDGPDVFVHCTSIIGEQLGNLNEGDVVEFELVHGAPLLLRLVLVHWGRGSCT